MNCLQIPLKSYSNERRELCLIGSGPSFQSTPNPTTIVITSIMILPAVTHMAKPCQLFRIRFPSEQQYIFWLDHCRKGV